MGGFPDDGIGAADATDFRNGKVVLANVTAFGADFGGDFGMVVDDEGDVVFFGDGLDHTGPG